jgi:hypothetical protein
MGSARSISIDGIAPGRCFHPLTEVPSQSNTPSVRPADWD